VWQSHGLGETHDSKPAGAALQATLQTEEVTALGYEACCGIQRKGILALYKTYYGIFSGGTTGGEKVGSWKFGKEQTW